jgi:hypothetical protein
MPDLRPLPPIGGSSPAAQDDLPGLPAGMPSAKTPSMVGRDDLPPDGPGAGVRTAGFTGTNRPAESDTDRMSDRAVERLDKSTDRTADRMTSKAMTRPPMSSMKEGSPLSEPAGKSGLSARAPSGPLFRLVNTKRITLNFEVKDVGASGLAGVDLWYTQDGKEWKKHEAPTKAQAYVVEVDEEGIYGFTLVARSGIGLGQEPPGAGDQPQVWVIVDLTPPEILLADPAYKGKSKDPVHWQGEKGAARKPAATPDKDSCVTLRWQATDKNLGRQPVTLFYSVRPEGPWQVIASNLPAIGSYKWDVTETMPPKVYVKAEAADMAGNLGKAISIRPIMLDNSTPIVRIRSVEGNGGR